MILPEKEARFKVCPLLATPDGKMRFCQGAQCMMWRFAEAQEGDESAGFCGLACAPVATAKKAQAMGFMASGAKKEPENPFG
ncbi:hypothetical protein [Fundidesulfovibrio soli]|uniref:hypothetical protein n=1 Tax=Fundidesulfovibrio soli TaxID=2922716 RepID=UPI001FAF4419|nr:hypothetical protein [Fundidesulfovibrio soli]